MRKEQIPLIQRVDQLHHQNQVLAVAGVTLALFATGNILGYSSLTIPALISSESEITTTSDDISWIASLVTLGCIFGSLVGGIAAEVIGRKKTILLASIFFSVGWIYIARAQTVRDILIGRLITGITSGSYTSAVQVYICEIVEPGIRGVCGALPSLMVSIGIFCIYCLGSVLPWRAVAHVCACFPAFVFIYTLFLPESPVWLLSRGKQMDAFKSLSWLRNDPEAAQQECMRLEYLEERRLSRRFSLRNCYSRFLEGSVLKPLTIGMALFYFQQFSGIYSITFYATLIFKYADDFKNDSLETIALGIVRMFGTFVAIFLVRFLDRRPLLIASGILMFLSNVFLGGYFFLRKIEGGFENGTVAGFDAHVDVEFNGFSIDWLPLTCLILFMAGYVIGFGIIPWFFIAEILPADVRSLACAVAVGFCQLCTFTTVKVFFDMIQLFNTYGTFWFYAGNSLLGVLFVSCCVPETSNLNSSEIEAIFETSVRLHKKSDDRDDAEETTDL